MNRPLPANVLLIRFKSIGDVVLTLPAVAAIRDHFPDAKISFLVSAELAAIVQCFADVNEVIPVDRAAFHSKNPLTVCTTGVRLFRELRRRKFSLTVDFQGYGETALLGWLSGAGERWGSVYGRGRRWAYTRGVARENSLHVADWYLSLLRRCGLKTGTIRNEFVLPPAALAAARQFFTAHHLDPAKPTLFIQPFTSTPMKNWPLENFLALARHWQSRGVQILFGGGPSERAALEPARGAGFPVAAGVPLLVSAGLAKLSTLVVGGDTGLLHIAVAMDKRVLMLMSCSSAAVSHPFRHPDWTLTPPAGKDMAGLETEVVRTACARTFSKIDNSSALRAARLIFTGGGTHSFHGSSRLA